MYWNNVETMPGKGYPRNWQASGGGFDKEGEVQPGKIPNLKNDYGIPWEYHYEAVLMQGIEPFLKPLEKPLWGPNWDEDQGEGEFPNTYYFYLPRLCNHCSKPACLSACPRKAIYKREEDGIVLVDLKRCRGYRYCLESCPYKKIYYNPLIKKVEKCIFCFPRVEKSIAQACARQCVGRIRQVGYLDDHEGAVYKLVHQWEVALPLRADFGTQPNVFYVPPLSPPKFNPNGDLTEEPRIPGELLIKLFGPTVPKVLSIIEEEISRKRAGDPSELMDLLIGYVHREMFRL
jgi:DMSO reductase family type II enzyme iron-sulfur subunit